MSSSTSKTLSFSVGHDDSSLKLIELPDELLELLQSDHPPTLQIKSKAVPEPGSKTGAGQPFAVLCSDDTTYQLRQQQTSNSLYVVKPDSSIVRDDEISGGVLTIASCSATLELSPSNDSAETYLRASMKTWNSETEPGDMEIDGHTKNDVYENIPLSKVEIDRDWDQLCAFEHSGVCYLPTNAYQLAAWKSIIAAGYAENFDLSNYSQDDALWKSVSDEGIPLGLFLVLMSRSRQAYASIWLSRLLLESFQEKPIARNDFVNSLKDILPHGLTPPDSFDAFKGFADLSDSTSLSFKAESILNTRQSTAAALASKRTWHERLKKK